MHLHKMHLHKCKGEKEQEIDMKALSVLEIKSFMTQLFLKETFDFFLLHELEIQMASQFKINGHLNKKWYDSSELEAMGNREYAQWKEFRGFAFQIIKGNKSPQFMKIVFSLPEEQVKKVLERSGSSFLPEQVEGLFLNLRYENGQLHLVTGSSVRVFSMDKTLEQEWDKEVAEFLKKCSIPCEEV